MDLLEHLKAKAAETAEKKPEPTEELGGDLLAKMENPEAKPKGGFSSEGIAARMEGGDGAPQCDCGAHIAGECPECDGSTPHKLGPMPEPPPGDGDRPQQKSQDGTREVCPTCGKAFKHLAKHKCKGAAPQEKRETPALNPPPAVEVSREPEKKEASEEPPAEPEGAKGYVLLIDALYEAVEEDVDIVYLGELVAPLCLEVAQENRVAHWQLVEYARGPGFLSVKLERYLVETGVDGAVYLDSMTPEGKACKETLRRHARAVIQGVR